MAAMFEPEQIGLLMRSMRVYPYATTRFAMLFSIYTAVRPCEIRMAEWDEITSIKSYGAYRLRE